MNFLPVTAVKFIPNSNLILSASGNELALHNVSDKSMIDRILFPQIKIIHGIKLNSDFIIVYGGFFFDICQFIDKKLIYKSNIFITKHNDFILDCFIYNHNNNIKSSKISFCVSLSHGGTNFYELCTLSGNLQFVAVSIPVERTLLYCCHLFGDHKDGERSVFLAGGSVQNTIMIWEHCCEVKSEVKALAVLRGHKGAIFSINVDLSEGLMVSVGDDRSVLLWKSKTASKNNWEMVRNMFGHESRVWGGLSVPGTGLIITWGEDCSLRVWDDTGAQRSWTTPHQGRSIWTGDVKISGTQLVVATGGNDGALVISEISRKSDIVSEIALSLSDKTDFPRHIDFICGDVPMLITDHGLLYVIDKHSEKITSVITDIDKTAIERYSVSYVHQRLPLIFFGNIRGLLTVATVSLGPPVKFTVLQTFELHKKIMIIGWGFEDDLFISLSDGTLLHLLHQDGSFVIGSLSFNIENTWAICWAYWENEKKTRKFLCGTRKGHLSLFVINEENKAIKDDFYSKTISKMVCGKDGITSIVRDKKNGLIYIGNRNGEVYSLNEEGISVGIVLKNPSLLAIVSRLTIDPFGQLTVLGFKSTLFRKVIIRGDEESLVLEHRCGGMNRDWDYYCDGVTRKMMYIHTGSVHVATWSSLTGDPCVIKPHLHGKEINCCLLLNNRAEDGRVVILNGSEDRTLSSLTYNISENEEVELDNIQKLHSHISSVRSVTEISMGMIVSGGGRGHMVLWQRTERDNLRAISSVLLKKLLSYDSDTRVMDMCSLSACNNEEHIDNDPLLAVACSSGSIIFLTCVNSRLHFRLQCPVSPSCLTSISFSKPSHLVTTCSTDGKLYWFQVLTSSSSDSSPSVGHISSLFIAKSSLHGLDILSPPLHSNSSDTNRSVLICLGGDDGAVRVIRLLNQPDNDDWKADKVVQYYLAHAGSTVSIKWVDNKRRLLVSLGSDEKMILWRLSESWQLIFVKFISDSVGVTDPHDFTFFRIKRTNNNNYCFYVAGMGARMIVCSIDDEN